MIRLCTRTFVFAAAIGVLAAAPAHAFTLQDSSGSGQVHSWMDVDSKSSGDLDKPSSHFDDGQTSTTIKQGNSTLQFGSQRSFNQRYDSNQLFNPYFRDGQQ